MKKEEFEFILEKGEGYFIEFKEKLDKSISRELVAFANSSGGQIFLGVNDYNKAKGVEITNKLKSQIHKYFDFEKHYNSGKLNGFLILSGITKNMDDVSILQNLGLLKKTATAKRMINAGVLFLVAILMCC